MSSLEMPAAFFGAYKKGNKYVKTTPREWTNEEVQWITTKINEGHKVEEIAAAIERSVVSVRLKMKRQTKTNDSYNEKTRAVKYAANERFFHLSNQTACLTYLPAFLGIKTAGLKLW